MIMRHHFFTFTCKAIHIIIFITQATITTSPQLYAMEALEPSADARNALWRDVTSKQSEDGQSLNIQAQRSMATDLQIYQLLSSIETDSPFYLFPELVQTIAVNAHTVTNLRCYEEHKICVDSIKSLLNFIKSQVEAGADSTSIVDILKRCLTQSGKSLGTIRNRLGETAFHAIIEEPSYGFLKTKEELLYGTDILCRVAGKDIIDLLCIQDRDSFTAWQHAIYFAHSAIVKKFIACAGNRIFELLSVDYNYAALDLAQFKREDLLMWISTPQYTGNVFKYWEHINELTIIIELLKPYYKKLASVHHFT